MSSVDECRMIDLPRINDPRGNLTFVESARHVPFEIKRVFYLYDVPGGETQGRTCPENLPSIHRGHVRQFRRDRG